ncbi:MAG: glycerophosphodiester phosphodiesterase [Candidatus Rifleibacteriota bacterium]
MFQSFYLLIHGLIADLTIPACIVALVIYFNNEAFNKFSAIFITIFNIVILLDYLHFFKYDFRLNIELLYLKTWLSFIHMSRLAFATILILNLAIFYLLKSKTNKKVIISSQQKKTWLALATILIIIQSLTLKANLYQFSSWNKYYSSKKAISQTVPAVSSFKSLFSKTIMDFFPEELDIFIASPFYTKFQKEFIQRTHDKAFSKTPLEENKIWSHRGFHKNAPQNSPEAVKLSLQNGIKGFEIDIRYVYGANKIVISHDPFPPAILAKKQDIFSFFDQIKSDLHSAEYIWLDFKNLYFTNIENSIKILKKLALKYKIDQKLLIESTNPFLLRKFANAGFKTILAIAYGQHNFKFTGPATSMMRSSTILSRCEFVTLPWQTMNYKSTWEALNGFPVGCYTVNDSNIIKFLVKRKSVFAILTDLEINPVSLLKNDSKIKKH